MLNQNFPFTQIYLKINFIDNFSLVQNLLHLYIPSLIQVTKEQAATPYKKFAPII
tara:strand:+ start:168 stop:332 length:165 start_codon:yes stop_codon:yes gene_type:complete